MNFCVLWNQQAREHWCVPSSVVFSVFSTKGSGDVLFVATLFLHSLWLCSSLAVSCVNVSHCALEDATHCSQSNFVFGPYIIQWLVPPWWTNANSVFSETLHTEMWTLLLRNGSLCGMHQAGQLKVLKITAMASEALYASVHFWQLFLYLCCSCLMLVSG